jgi:hypothetical protein
LAITSIQIDLEVWAVLDDANVSKSVFGKVTDCHVIELFWPAVLRLSDHPFYGEREVAIAEVPQEGDASFAKGTFRDHHVRCDDDVREVISGEIDELCLARRRGPSTSRMHKFALVDLGRVADTPFIGSPIDRDVADVAIANYDEVVEPVAIKIADPDESHRGRRGNLKRVAEGSWPGGVVEDEHRILPEPLSYHVIQAILVEVPDRDCLRRNWKIPHQFIVSTACVAVELAIASSEVNICDIDKAVSIQIADRHVIGWTFDG